MTGHAQRRKQRAMRKVAIYKGYDLQVSQKAGIDLFNAGECVRAEREARACPRICCSQGDGRDGMLSMTTMQSKSGRTLKTGKSHTKDNMAVTVTSKEGKAQAWVEWLLLIMCCGVCIVVLLGILHETWERQCQSIMEGTGW